MSNKKRVSVFARLGPAGPTSPDQSVPPPPGHRRYSSDKHLDKGHHSHPPPPLPPHPHPHSGGRDDSLRERKPSHSDYDEKKQLHYRDLPPPSSLSSSSSSRHRSAHKHYHDDLDKPPRELGRSEKRPSLSSPLPPPPPLPPRKSRDLSDRLSPTGKDILSKPFLGGYEDKLTKLSRSSSAGSGSNNDGGRGIGGGGGGGKGKRVSPPEPAEGDVMVDMGEEARRKRNRTEKKSKLEGPGGEDLNRWTIKSHHLSERERKEKERERHGWPDKALPLPPQPLLPPPTSSSSSSLGLGEVGGGGEGEGGREGRGRGSMRGEDRDARRKREDEWIEQRELGRKRKRENSEGNCTPPPDAILKRVRNSDPGSRDPGLDPANLSSFRDEKYPRQSKDNSDPLSRKRRQDHPLPSTPNSELNKDMPLPKKPRSGEILGGGGGGGGGGGNRKPSRGGDSLMSSSSSSMTTGGVRKRPEHHKGRGSEQEMEESDEMMKPPAKLDWSMINSLSLPRPKPTTTTAVQRFSPGAVFAQLGVSRTLAGTSLFELVSSAVSKHLAKEEEQLFEETGNRFTDGFLNRPFGDAEFAITGVSEIKTAKENCQVCVNIGPNRKALVASADFTMRRKIGKFAKGLLPPSTPTATWNAQNFSSARDLYNSLGTKASGKPAFRLEPSEVGSILIPK